MELYDFILGICFYFHAFVYLSYYTMKGVIYMNGQYYSYNINRQPMRPNGPRPLRPGPSRPPGLNQGRFLGPFILGGITGGLISPLFWGNNRPIYYPYYPPYGPYPYYYR